MCALQAHLDLMEELLAQPDVADRLLSRLPLSEFQSLSHTCAILRRLVQQQPEQAWLCQQRPSLPLLRAPSARAHLATLWQAHASKVSGRYSLQELTSPQGLVSCALVLTLRDRLRLTALGAGVLGLSSARVRAPWRARQPVVHLRAGPWAAAALHPAARHTLHPDATRAPLAVGASCERWQRNSSAIRGSLGRGGHRRARAGGRDPRGQHTWRVPGAAAARPGRRSGRGQLHRPRGLVCRRPTAGVPGGQAGCHMVCSVQRARRAGQQAGCARCERRACT